MIESGLIADYIIFPNYSIEILNQETKWCVLYFSFLTLSAQNQIYLDGFILKWHQKQQAWDFPGGAVVKNPPANAGDTGLSPGAGRSHMPRSN